MFQFTHEVDSSKPLDLTTYNPPDVDDRSGLPLSQGYVFTLFATVAGDHLPEQMLEQLRQVEQQAWYKGQVLEDLLTILEQRDPGLPGLIGKNMYYLLGPQYRAMGLNTAEEVLRATPGLWVQVARGDAGEWRLLELEKGHAVLEVEQPYNCWFEASSIVGALEAFDATEIHLTHSPCMRDGSPCCRLEVRWQP